MQGDDSKATDFDRWCDLAEKDLSLFERQRLKAINEFIDAAPVKQQERLKRLQWRIDQERIRSDSPMGACMRISKMMWEQLLGERGLLRYLDAANPESDHPAKAEVIALNRNKPLC